MMNPLDYFLPQPAFDLSPARRHEFEGLFSATPPGAWIDYRLDAPKWQFLSYLCQSKNLVLHGSQNTEIEVVEPRQAIDTKAFSNQQAIYATTDGLWVIYFAIIDRKKFSPLSLFNSCLEVQISSEQVLGPFYFFSVTHTALIQNPWCEGGVYILPRSTFEREPTQRISGAEVTFPHWVSTHAARPVAKLRVGPQDFPCLAQVHGHDDEQLARLASANPDGFPWPEALVV